MTIANRFCRQLLLIFIVVPAQLNGQITKLTAFPYDAFGGPSAPVQSASLIFFSAPDGLHGRELWCTDGTPNGTYMVKDINPGVNSGIADYFEYTAYVMNNVLYFRGNDGINGVELWRSDGTSSGTFMVKNLDGGPGDSAPGEFASVNNTLYFTAQTGTQLWKSDGTNSGTTFVESFNIATNLFGFNGALYFSGDNSNSGQELWKSNGTPNGTNLLKDLNVAIGASLPCNFHATSSLLYFMAVTNDGWELWKTDGTNSGTLMVKDINPGGANGILTSYSDAYMNHIGDTLFFKADDGVNGFQLWKSDGTTTGTVRISSLPDFVDSYCTFPVSGTTVLVNNYALTHFWGYDISTGNFYETNYPTFQYFNSLSQKFVFNGSQMYYCGKDSVFGSEIRYCDNVPGSDRMLHETHLTDNWTPLPGQYFNKVYGIINNKLIYAAGRQPYNTLTPLFAYEISGAPECLAPVTVVPVPVADTAAHLIWSAIPEAVSYTVLYRQSTAPAWDSVTTTDSYFAWNTLSPASDFEFLLRVNCNSGAQLFSDTVFYNTAFTGNDYIVHVLGDKSESETVHRLYWLQSPLINSIQIRYRPNGTTTWNTVNNNNGYRRLTNLQPSTLYEYQVRANIGGTWDVWSVTSLYFYTRDNSLTGEPNELSEVDDGMLYPNPASDMVIIKGKPLVDDFDILIADLPGRIVSRIKGNNRQFSVAGLPSGVYLVIISDRHEQMVSRLTVVRKQ